MPSSTLMQVEMECDHPLQIPTDIQDIVLTRLPVRTLIRLQCVSKDWKKLLNEPSFIQEHLRHSARENPSLLYPGYIIRNSLELHTIDKEMQVFPFESIPLIECLPSARVIGSINGLLCVYSIEKCLDILLWNPAIRKFRLLTREANFWVKLGFVKMGFGFCSIVNDYKVVVIRHPGFPYMIDQVEVYSLSKSSWKRAEFGELLDGVVIMSDGFGINGAIFWDGYKMGNVHLLVSYYIATEEFALIPPPPGLQQMDSFYHSLSAYENKLAFLSHTTIGKSEYSLIDLWVMEEGKDSKSEERWRWTKKYSIKHPYLLHPMVVWRNMIVCAYADLSREPNTASEHEVIDDRRDVLVNITTNELKRFAVPKYKAFYCVFNHVESLVPVDNL